MDVDSVVSRLYDIVYAVPNRPKSEVLADMAELYIKDVSAEVKKRTRTKVVKNLEYAYSVEYAEREVDKAIRSGLLNGFDGLEDII